MAEITIQIKGYKCGTDLVKMIKINKMANGTQTSAFGTSGRVNHDSSKFYNSKMYNELSKNKSSEIIKENTLSKQNLNKIFCSSSEKMKEFMHFGAELSEESQKMLMMGDKITSIFDQASVTSRPYALSVFLYTAVWSGYWLEKDINGLRLELKKLTTLYLKNSDFRKQVNDLITNSASLSYLIESMKSSQANILQLLSQLK